MWIWLLLPVLGLASFLFYLVFRNYLACRKLVKKYSESSTMLFFPFAGYMSKLQESLKKYGDSIEFFVKERRPGQKLIVTNLGIYPYVIFYDWQLAKEYLQRHHEFIKENRFLFSEFYYTKNLVSQEGEEWKRQKKILSHAMNFDFFEMITPTINKLVDGMVAEVQPDVPMRVTESCFKVTTETVGYAFFSKDLNVFKVNGHKIVYLLKETINFALMRSLTFSFVLRKMLLPYPSVKWGVFLNKKEKVALDNFLAVKAIVLEQIKERMEQIKKGEDTPKDFMGYYLEQYLSEENQKTKKIDMEEILQQFDSLLSAGSDTTAALATACVYCLAKYPEEYFKLEAIITSLPESPTPQDLSALAYLTFYIKEVTRFYPPANDIFPRYTPTDIKIGEFEFPANTYFGIGIKTIMNDP